MDRKTLLRDYLSEPISLTVKVMREARREHTRLAKLVIKVEERGRRGAVKILVDHCEGRISYSEALKTRKALRSLHISSTPRTPYMLS